MTSIPVEGSRRSSRRYLIDRLRFILVICAVVASGFAARELASSPYPLGPQFATRLLGIGLAIVGVVALKGRWAVRVAWPLATGIIAFAYAITAFAGIVGPTHEYTTTALLFVGAALITATVMPWGLVPQAATVLVGALALGAAVLWKDGGLDVVATDPGAAVLMAFALSVVTAREFDRYRVAHRRELLERQRADATVRRLNAHLERRVADRTAALTRVNERLAAEIEERRQTARAMRATQAQLADTVDHSTAIVSLKDMDGRYLLVNREFERLFGCRRLVVVGRTDADLFPVPLAERMGRHDLDVLHGGTPVSFEQELVFADGPRAYVWVKFPLRGSDGSVYGIGSMATDITMVKELQEELRRHQDELAHALRLHTIGEMAAALAHEINQPLCAIANYAQGGAQRLRAEPVELPPLLEAFEHISHEALRAAEILRGIRGLIRRDTDLEEPVDVNAVAGEALRVLEPQARLHGVAVRLQCAPDLPLVHANATQIEQVIVNLMLNGVQATTGTPGPRREVLVVTSSRADTVEVTVSDTGQGIPPAVAGKLFTPFVTTKARGLGLGLAISRSIIENHGGRLWALPNAGAGTTFRFSLPVLPQAADAPPLPAGIDAVRPRGARLH